MTPLPFRRFGRIGARVTEIGLGGAGLHASFGRLTDEKTAIACVHRALELGINFIDTSPAYGDSERRIGLALDDASRDRIFLSTKTGTGSNPPDYSGEGTRRSVERSLKRLKTDRIDLLLIHDPENMTEAMSIGGALDALLDLKERGVIGAIGLGVREHDFLLQAIRHGAFDAILTFGDYNLVRRTALPLLAEAKARDIGVALGSPLLFGSLSDRPWDVELHARHPDEESQLILRIRRWTERRGIGMLPLAMQFCLREPNIDVILSGSASPEEIEANVRAVSDPLPEELWTEFEAEFGAVSA